MEQKFATFEELLVLVPEEIKMLIEGLKQLRERPDFHPEENCWIHVKIVTERLITTGDIDLIIAGLFHDCGKLVMNKTNPKSGFPTAPGHDKFGAEKVIAHKEWVSEMGADPEMVAEICAQHMRIKQIGEMKPAKQKAMRDLKCFDKLCIFEKADDMLRPGNI